MNKDEIANKFGISKTVYSLIYRETEAIEAVCRDKMPRELYGQPWTGKQDDIHEDFFRVWANVMCQPVTDLGFENMKNIYPHYYPTNGSSEAIREVIAQIGSNTVRSEEYIIVFNGEYEGYKAYADSYNIRVVEIDRKQEITFDSFINLISEEGRYPHLFISQPSSIDGNVWDGFDNTLNIINKINDKYRDVNIKVHVDLCYVGCTNGIKYKIDLSHSCIETVFFSLSKVYGVYYHRIGGVWSKSKIDSLWGNRWFKNLFSLYFGCHLMEKLGYDFPAKYAALQARSVRSLTERPEFEGIIIEPSDVFLLANSPITKSPSEIQREFQRANSARFCLTPGLSSALSIKEQALSTDPFGVAK